MGKQRDNRFCKNLYSKFLRYVVEINPFLANIPILYSQKTPENQRFSGVFRGYKMGTLTENRLN